MTVHPLDCDCPTLGCELRRKGIQVPPSATPTRTPRRPFRPGPRHMSWEAGRAGEHRPDGSFSPYLHPGTGTPISTKDWADNRRDYEAKLRRAKAG